VVIKKSKEYPKRQEMLKNLRETEKIVGVENKFHVIFLVFVIEVSVSE